MQLKVVSLYDKNRKMKATFIQSHDPNLNVKATFYLNCRVSAGVTKNLRAAEEVQTELMQQLNVRLQRFNSDSTS